MLFYRADGEMQRYIRGSGLAYGASVSIEREAGFLSFSLYRVSLLASMT
jgi:Zn-dependent M16 (insulinase) family peptidase